MNHSPPKPMAPTVQVENIPAELRSLVRFVNWRYVWREGKNGKPGKWTKVPLNPATGGKARSNDPRTWGTLDAAIDRLRRFPAHLDGIGFMLGDGWVGVDADDCFGDDGEVSELAAAIVEKFNTYTEVSPSRRGLKLIGKGVTRLPRNCGCNDRTLRLEVYAAARFFTLTGQKYHGDGPAEAADAIDWLYRTYLPHKMDRPKQAGCAQTPIMPTNKTDAELIELMTEGAANAAKVRALWDGEIPAGKSQSEADMALLMHLAFYTQKDASRMERMFGLSVLGQRAKWTERKDYRDRSISKAIEQTTSVYAPAAPARFVFKENSIDAGESVTAPDIKEANGSRPLFTSNGRAAESGAARSSGDEAGSATAPPEPDPRPQRRPPMPDGPDGPHKAGGGYVVAFRHGPRNMTEVFLFRDGARVDSDKLDIRSSSKREKLVAHWTTTHWGLDAQRLRGILTAYSFVDPPKCNGPADMATDDNRRVVELTNDEKQDRAAVLPVLAVDPRLFARDGILVRPKTFEQPVDQNSTSESGQCKLTFKHPAGSTAMIPASVAYVRTRITDGCRLTRPGQGNSPCPDYLPSSIHADPVGIREVRGLALGPIIRPDGSLLNTVGFDEESGLYLAAHVPGLDDLIPESVTLADAQKRIRGWWDPLLRDFPWKGANDQVKTLQRAKWYTLLFTALLRHMLEQVPLGMITANTAGTGKTYLCQMIGITAHDVDPITMTWPEGSRIQNRGDEVRKRLASLLHEGATLALIDNLMRGACFQSPELDAFLTSPSFYDRQLHRNDGARAGGAQRCQLLATGNNVVASGDTADRTLTIELELDHPNPRSRPVTQFGRGDALAYAKRHRRELLAAALTSIRAWIQAGCPCPRGESWGTFGEWTERAAAIVRWLYPGIDPLEGRGGAATDDPETQTLVGLIVAWERLLGAEFVTVGRILKEVDEYGPDRSKRELSDTQEALRDRLYELCGVRSVPTGPRLGHALAGYVGKRVPIERVGGETRLGWIESDKDTHNKQQVYRVQTKITATP